MEVPSWNSHNDKLEVIILKFYSCIVASAYCFSITNKFIPQGKNSKTCFVIAIGEKILCFDRNITSERKN